MQTENLTLEEKNLVRTLILGSPEACVYPNDDELKYYRAGWVKKLFKKALKNVKPEYKNFFEETFKKIKE